MSDDFFDKDIGIDDKIIIYDETEAKESYYNTKDRSHLPGDTLDEDQESIDSESKRKGSLATIIASVSLMIFVVLYFILNKDWQFIGAAFPSIGGLVAYFLDSKSKLSKLYLGLSILTSIGFILGVLVQIITFVRM